MNLAKGDCHTFATCAMKTPQLNKAVITAFAAEVCRECQSLCSTLPGKKSILRQTSALHQEYIRRGKESVVLGITVCKHSLKEYRGQVTHYYLILHMNIPQTSSVVTASVRVVTTHILRAIITTWSNDDYTSPTFPEASCPLVKPTSNPTTTRKCYNTSLQKEIPPA